MLPLCLLAILPALPVSEAVAIEHVSAIPMDRERVLADVTVLLADGRIAAIGRDVAVPAGARRVDGRGKWLIPGLADMHCHLISDDRAIAEEYAPDELAVIIANGVTTMRDPIGKPELLALKRKVAAGELLGPRMWIGSPQVAGRKYGKVFLGREVTTPEAARQAVIDFAGEGYDFIKLTTHISLPVHDAVVEQARASGIRVFGHVGPQVRLPRALEAGQQIEHLDQFLEMLVPEGAAFPDSASDSGVWKPEFWQSLDWLDAARIPAVAKQVSDAGVWNTPTLAFLHTAFGNPRTREEIEASPDWRFVSPKVRDHLLRGWVQWAKNMPSPERRARYVELRLALTKALQDAGAKLMAGSDCSEWLLLYGFTLHRELEAFAAAGLTPWQVLATATRNPHEWLGDLAEVGTLEPGKRADVVLLSADPLAATSNTQRIEAVAVGGRWLDRAALDALLEKSRQRLSSAQLAE